MNKHRQNKHYQRFEGWRREAAIAIRRRRGGQSCLALHLGVTRMTVSRWLRGESPMPGWAAVAFNIWWNRNREVFVTSQADTEDVTPEADKGVTFQADGERVAVAGGC